MVSLDLDVIKYKNKARLMLGILLGVGVMYFGLDRLLLHLEKEGVSSVNDIIPISIVRGVFILAFLIAGVFSLIFSLLIAYKAYELFLFKNNYFFHLENDKISVKSPFDYKKKDFMLDNILSIKAELVKNSLVVTIKEKRNKWCQFIFGKHAGEYMFYVNRSEYKKLADYMKNKPCITFIIVDESGR